MEIEEAREWLSGYFMEKSCYRRDIADNRCDSSSSEFYQNQTYAERLEDVAEYVKRLPDDSLILQRVTEYEDWPITPFSCDKEALDNAAIHCRYHNGYIGVWLSRWMKGWPAVPAKQV